MSSPHSVAHAIAAAAHDLDDSFALSADDLPKPSNVTYLRDHRAARPAPRTLAECVPLLTVALEFVDRGPAAITVEGVEAYRANAIRLLEHVRPVIERQAGQTLADWAARSCVAAAEAGAPPGSCAPAELGTDRDSTGTRHPQVGQ